MDLEIISHYRRYLFQRTPFSSFRRYRWEGYGQWERYMSILALDIGGTVVKSGLFSADGILLKNGETPSYGHLGVNILMAAVYQAVQSYEGYQAIGISTAGQVDSRMGVITYANKNIPGYTGTPLKALIEERFQVPAAVENDGIAAALGEGAYGAGQHLVDYICLTYCTGIGSGVIQNSRINHGPFEGEIGELGHICLHPMGRPCACGHLGCYEQYGSTTALVRTAKALDNRVTDGRRLFELTAESKDLQAVVAEWLSQIALGLVKIQQICSTRCMIVGGGVFDQPTLLNGLQQAFVSLVAAPAPELRRAALGNQAGLYGAMVLAQSMCEDKALPKNTRKETCDE